MKERTLSTLGAYITKEEKENQQEINNELPKYKEIMKSALKEWSALIENSEEGYKIQIRYLGKSICGIDVQAEIENLENDPALLIAVGSLYGNLFKGCSIMSEVKEWQNGSSRFRQGHDKEIWSEMLPKKDWWQCRVAFHMI